MWSLLCSSRALATSAASAASESVEGLLALLREAAGRRAGPPRMDGPGSLEERVGWLLIMRAARYLLSDISRFASVVLKRPLRGYQTAPLRPILRSILNQQGLEFLLVFPRQSGKNEAVAQLLTYLLNLYARLGGTIVYGAVADTLGVGVDRLEQRLDNTWNANLWRKRSNPNRRCLRNACVAFLSSHPQASARGQTADWLLVMDEAQDQIGPHVEAVFTPMRAANNATAVYIGTVKLTTDFLWTKKLELEAEQQADGIQRVFMVTPEQVAAENHAFQQFLERQVRRHGRHHPIVASEYFLEPIDGSGSLFDARRRQLMHGDHCRLPGPEPGHLYVATLDVAGEDEAATDPVARLIRPGRDYTVATVFDVAFQRPGTYAPGPTYRAVDVFVDHGSKHFQDVPGRPALIHRLHAWLEHWSAAHVVADASGVGQGLVAWLEAAMGSHRVTGFDFSAANAKAALGSAFLALIETGRFRYWTGDQAEPGSDGWWFWQQVLACTFELPDEGQFDRNLRWSVAPAHRTETASGPQPTHDDRLISAALVAELDRLYRAGKLTLGTATSAMIEARDPLGEEIY